MQKDQDTVMSTLLEYEIEGWVSALQVLAKGKVKLNAEVRKNAICSPAIPNQRSPPQDMQHISQVLQSVTDVRDSVDSGTLQVRVPYIYSKICLKIILSAAGYALAVHCDAVVRFGEVGHSFRRRT
jgi:hypothetical protein